MNYKNLLKCIFTLRIFSHLNRIKVLEKNIKEIDKRLDRINNIVRTNTSFRNIRNSQLYKDRLIIVRRETLKILESCKKFETI